MSPVTAARRHGILEWAVAVEPLAGQSCCGDDSFTRAGPGAALAAVIDGLGHGDEAAAAAAAITGCREDVEPGPLPPIFERCHQAARRTRGAAMAAAHFEAATATLTWMGVGNVSAVLLRPHTRPLVAARALCGGGVVGYRLPRHMVTSRVPIEVGDIVVMMTDGVRDDVAALLLEDVGAAGLDDLAGHVLSEGAKGTDDALVWAGRYLGADGHDPTDASGAAQATKGRPHD